jgi:hypothetical protein
MQYRNTNYDRKGFYSNCPGMWENRNSNIQLNIISDETIPFLFSYKNSNKNWKKILKKMSFILVFLQFFIIIFEMSKTNPIYIVSHMSAFLTLEFRAQRHSA